MSYGANNNNDDSDSTRRPSNFDDVEAGSTKKGPEINVSTQCTKYLTWIGAFFILLHNGLRITEMIHARQSMHHSGGFNMTRYEDLNPVDIAARWEIRRSNRALHVFDEIAGIVGWMCVLPVIMVAVKILARGNPTSYVQWATPMFAFAVLIRILEWT